ncbi:hypothetical protein [uncultured Jatrophihabitans sp.]|uniref:hypothetical protein n=1 Tax=uncultured Jatrophihabitans sp. TaxID=1610747 RepID=UPI0035CA5626
MPEIEFVEPDPDAGVDEELTTGPRRVWSARTTRVVRLSAAVVLAVVAGSAAVGLLTHGSRSGPSAGLTVVPGRAALVTGALSGTVAVGRPAPNPPPHGGPERLTGQPSSTLSTMTVELACPEVHACEVVLTLPPAMSTALAAHLAGVSGVVGGSVLFRSRSTLRSRQVTAHAGRLDIGVLVRPAVAGEHDRSRASHRGAGETVSATVVRRGLAITATVSGPATQAPTLAAVRSLAADGRLLTAE